MASLIPFLWTITSAALVVREQTVENAVAEDAILEKARLDAGRDHSRHKADRPNVPQMPSTATTAKGARPRRVYKPLAGEDPYGGLNRSAIQRIFDKISSDLTPPIEKNILFGAFSKFNMTTCTVPSRFQMQLGIRWTCGLMTAPTEQGCVHNRGKDESRYSGSGYIINKKGVQVREHENFFTEKLTETVRIPTFVRHDHNGFLLLKSGALYKGDFKCGDMTGTGTWYLPNGKALQGKFKKGKMYGTGYMWTADRKIAYELKDRKLVPAIVPYEGTAKEASPVDVWKQLKKWGRSGPERLL